MNHRDNDYVQCVLTERVNYSPNQDLWEQKELLRFTSSLKNERRNQQGKAGSAQGRTHSGTLQSSCTNFIGKIRNNNSRREKKNRTKNITQKQHQPPLLNIFLKHHVFFSLPLFFSIFKIHVFNCRKRSCLRFYLHKKIFWSCIATAF